MQKVARVLSLQLQTCWNVEPKVCVFPDGVGARPALCVLTERTSCLGVMRHMSMHSGAKQKCSVA